MEQVRSHLSGARRVDVLVECTGRHTSGAAEPSDRARARQVHDQMRRRELGELWAGCTSTRLAVHLTQRGIAQPEAVELQDFPT